MNKLKELWSEKKKLIIFISGCVLLVLVLLIILIFILANAFKRYDSHEIDNMMITATKKYLSAHQDVYPTPNNPISTIEVSTLVEGEYLKELSKISKESQCDGTIQIVYEKEEQSSPIYRYIPYLKCEHYETTSLLEVIQSKEMIQENQEGLNKLGDTYFYKGESVNNYLEYLKYSWRIFKFDKDRIYLVLSDTLNDKAYVFDDRYNEMAKSNRGKNTFENSRIYDTLNGFYDSFFAGHHAYLKNMDACTHTRSKYDTQKDGSIECFTTTSTPISLLTIYDYMNASLDPYCIRVEDRNCSNYNYLSNTSNHFWLLNGTNEDTYHVYYVNSSMNGAIQLYAANQKTYIRVVIALPSDVIFKSGVGTKDNPYTIYEF